MTLRLTVSDMNEIGGVSRNTIDRWLREGVLTVNAGAGGRGNHRTFGLLDALAIGYAMKWAEELEEHPFSRLAVNAGQFIQQLGLDAVKQALNEGRTVLIPPVLDSEGKGRLIRGPLALPCGVQLTIPDLGECYREVIAKVAEIAARTPVNNVGRNRGLVVNERGSETVVYAPPPAKKVL